MTFPLCPIARNGNRLRIEARAASSSFAFVYEPGSPREHEDRLYSTALQYARISRDGSYAGPISSVPRPVRKFQPPADQPAQREAQCVDCAVQGAHPGDVKSPKDARATQTVTFPDSCSRTTTSTTAAQTRQSGNGLPSTERLSSEWHEDSRSPAEIHRAFNSISATQGDSRRDCGSVVSRHIVEPSLRSNRAARSPANTVRCLVPTQAVPRRRVFAAIQLSTVRKSDRAMRRGQRAIQAACLRIVS